MNKEEITRIVIESLPTVNAPWTETLTALLTPIIAMIAVYIAFQQHKLNEQRLRHEVYERRLKVYKAVQKHLSSILGAGKTTYPLCAEFYSEAAEASFLFDNSVQEKIDEIYKKSITLVSKHEEMYPSDGSPGLPVGKERSRVAQENAALLGWHTEQLETSKEFFAEKLGLKNT